ncbi:MAG TPA: LysR family transcriptional regulator [Burkholderiaceae bacterium]|nr:LysR family transcriptional regulator [Burkholderiaceae bacterium]
MRHATLRQLKVFEAVARLSSYSRAAEELHLTQPAVSTQIRKLEGHAGLPLFEQLGKKIFLTAAGQELLHHSHLIIQQFEQAEAAMTHFKGVSGGRLNVDVISAGDYFLPSVLVAFARRHEGVKINLSVHSRRELLSRLSENLTDLAVMVRPPEDADTVAEPFAPHPYVMVAPPGHPLVAERAIPLARVVREPFILREPGSDTRHSMIDALGRHAAQLNVVLEVKSTETIKQAVAAGMGVAFLSGHTVSRELRDGSLAVLDVQGFPVRLHWYLVSRRNKRLPPVAQAFRAFLLAEGEALLERVVPLPRAATAALARRGKPRAGAKRPGQAKPRQTM